MIGQESSFDFGEPASEVKAPGSPMPMGQETTNVGPAPQPPNNNASASRGAGVAIVFAAIGGGVGAVLGGPWGLGAGILLVGALRNGARARNLWGSPNELDREEAAKSATMGIVGAAGAGYLGYRAYRKESSDG